MGAALQREVARLKLADYLDRLSLSVLEKGFSNETKLFARKQETDREILVLISFFLDLSSNMKEFAKPFGVRVVFNNDI